jgi:anti-anti-sigma factor
MNSKPGKPARYIGLSSTYSSGGITVTITYLRDGQGDRALGSRRATRSEPLVVTGHDQHGVKSELVIAAVGEVDAGNAKAFADQVCALIAAADPGQGVTVDLSELDFFAVDGCTALHAVNALVMRCGTSWAVVPSPAVNRVLQLCDPASLIPLTEAELLAEPA